MKGPMPDMPAEPLMPTVEDWRILVTYLEAQKLPPFPDNHRFNPLSSSFET